MQSANQIVYVCSFKSEYYKGLNEDIPQNYHRFFSHDGKETGIVVDFSHFKVERVEACSLPEN